MACGPAQNGSTDGAFEPFSFANETALVGMTMAITTFWSLPMKAAFVVANEAMREGFGLPEDPLG
ncbi:MAG: hypothetical protein ACFBSD_09630 [Paracoccaceae bacterium]